MKPKKILIIGQGIAGSVMAWHCMKAGHTVLIIDDHNKESSTMISAGIINPITGQRLVVVPEFSLYFHQAMSTYKAMSAELGESFFIPKPIIRVIRSAEELNRARHLQTLASAQAYITEIAPPGYYGNSLIDPFGTLVIAQGGSLQTRSLLLALKQYFLDRQMLVLKHLAYDELTIKDHGIDWQDQTFDAVIFCEGFKAKDNPWFKDLPYNFAKGEILQIDLDKAALPDAILCQQQWCLPCADQTYLAGSTYDRVNINTMTTEEGQSEIIKGLSQFIALRPNILNAYAAVRPVMLNTQPILAVHAHHPRLGIFNGFASKGMLWAPYFAQHFIKNFIAP